MAAVTRRAHKVTLHVSETAGHVTGHEQRSRDRSQKGHVISEVPRERARDRRRIADNSYTVGAYSRRLQKEDRKARYRRRIADMTNVHPPPRMSSSVNNVIAHLPLHVARHA
eukprot:2188857-Rhodomonas_salina.1